METAESTISDLLEKVRAWIPRRVDPRNVSRDFWMPDHSCRVCYECDSQFTVFIRRHHCRMCGRVFCWKCTQNTIALFADGQKNGREDGERIRVCNFCFKLCKQEIAAQHNGVATSAISPSASVVSFDSSKSGSNNSTSAAYTPYSTGPSQHSNTGLVIKASEIDRPGPLLERKHDIPHSESNNGALSSVERASSPSLLAYRNNRSDDEDDEYGKDNENSQRRLFRQSEEYFGEHNDISLDPGYILSNISPGNSSFQNSVDHASQAHGSSKFENYGKTVCGKSPSFQTDMLVEQQLMGRSEEDCEDTDNVNDCNDESAMFQSENTEVEQPIDFENNGLIWIPPQPEDEEDEIDTSVFDDDDDDDGCWGLPRSSGSFGSNEFRSKDRSSQEHREAMRAVVDGHFRALVAQLLKGEDVPVGEENDKDSWLEIVTSLSWQAATFVKPDTSKGGGMDPGGYVKVKCLVSGHRNESKVIKGVVCSKNVKHKRMTSRFKNPRLLLLGGALEYQRVSNQLSSLDTLLQQEMDHLKMTVTRIEAHHPNVLLVEKTVSHHAQEELLAKEISLVLNVKRPLLERIARCTGAQIVPSLDNLAATKLGHCELFHVDKFLEEHGSSGQTGKKLPKTLMFFEGCPRRLGCTVVLMGACRDELKKVKHVVQYAVFAAYHLALETSFLADEGATLPELPLRSPITVALPDKQLSLDRSISTIPGFTIPIGGQTSTVETQILSTKRQGSTVFLLPGDPLNGKEAGLKPSIMRGGIGSSVSGFSSHVPSNYSSNGTDPSQTKVGFNPSATGTYAEIMFAQQDISSASERVSLPSAPPGNLLSGLSASLKTVLDAAVPLLDSGLDGAVTSNIGFQERELKGIVTVGSFGVTGSSQSPLDYEIVRGDVPGNMLWENQGITENEITSKAFVDEQITGYKNQEQGFSKEEFAPSPNDHQSILVSLSSRCVLKGTVCERSQLFRIKYYGSFDKPLGRYLRDALFDQSYRCRFCNEPAEAHVHCYTHRQGSLTISVKRLPAELTLPGEREGKIWMWHRCLKCARKNGVPQATRRVAMSDAAWGLSFGKFLELSFSNHAAASRVASCGHSLHRDCLRFYGFGSMLACFRYAPINVLSVHLPPSKLEFNDPNQQGWLRKEAAEVADSVELLFAEIFDNLRQIGQKISSSGSCCSGLKDPEPRRKMTELEGMLQKEKTEFEESLQRAITSNWQPGQPAADILELNYLRRQLLIKSYVWDQRLRSLTSSLKVKNSSVRVDCNLVGDSNSPYSKENNSSPSEKLGECQSMGTNASNADCAGVAGTEINGCTADGKILDSSSCSCNLHLAYAPIGKTDIKTDSFMVDQLKDPDGVNARLDDAVKTAEMPYNIGNHYMDHVQRSHDGYVRGSAIADQGVMFHPISVQNDEFSTDIKLSENTRLRAVNRRDSSDLLEGDMGLHRTLSEGYIPGLADLSDTLEAAWTGEGQLVKAQGVLVTFPGQEVGLVSPAIYASGGSEPEVKNISNPVLPAGRSASADSILYFQDKGGLELSQSSTPTSPVKSFSISEDFGSQNGSPLPNFPKAYSRGFQGSLTGALRPDILSGYNTTFVSSVSHLAGHTGARLLLPTGVNETVVAVYDDEPTSIIAYALTSREYQAHLSNKAPDNEKSKEKDRDKEKETGDLSAMDDVSFPVCHPDGSLDLVEILSKERNSGSDDTYSSKGTGGSDSLPYSKAMHVKISFSDESPPGKVKYMVTCYYAKQFDALRRKCCPSELDFTRSLSRCKRWGAQGGKSNVFFAKSLDDRFVIKQVTKTELESFIKFASEYFKYLSDSLNSGSPTCLAKILGIYQVTVKHAKGGKEVRMDLMVMENLLFGRTVTRLYDLKGSGRSRYNADSTGSNKVLLDQNLLEAMPTSPIFLGNKAKRLLERAVWNDTSFLASIYVMDYSLLVGVDEERQELVLGIIDFMRQYTWDKHLETWVKASGILGGPKNISPTVISPKEYKKRFRKAMSTYFLVVPDQWSPPTIISSPLQNNAAEDGFSISIKEDAREQVA